MERGGAGRGALLVGVLGGLVLLGGVGALNVVAPPAPRSVGDAVREYREGVRAPAVRAPRTAVPSPAASAARSGSRSLARAPRAGASPAAASRPTSPASRPGLVGPGAAPAADAPAPGVYTYATAGSEQVELLGTDRHDYPGTTAITLTGSGCGLVSTWSPVEGREERRATCSTAHGQELRGVRSAHRFLRVDDARAYTCPAGSVELPADPAPGSRRVARCRGAGDDTLTLTTVVVARERLPVGDVAVDVVHLRTTGLLSGTEQGRSSEDRWVTRTGLLVRQLVDTTGAKRTPLGTARYREHVELRLASLRPQA